MTRNQLTYHANLEQARANRAQEAETHRKNVAAETLDKERNIETARSNKVKETETQRHNTVTENEANRHNQRTETLEGIKHQETARHNKRTEDLTDKSITAGIIETGMSTSGRMLEKLMPKSGK